MVDETRIQKVIERRLENYRQRYYAPNAATLRKWRRQAIQECDSKNQLPLPLVFDNEIAASLRGHHG